MAAYKWRRKRLREAGPHINVLEAQAGLQELKGRARTARLVPCRFLHLLDSIVAIGVLARRRSSSHRLRRVVRRAAALELASDLYPTYAYIRSAHNPSDFGSRFPGRFRYLRNAKKPLGVRLSARARLE